MGEPPVSVAGASPRGGQGFRHTGSTVEVARWPPCPDFRLQQHGRSAYSQLLTHEAGWRVRSVGIQLTVCMDPMRLISSRWR